MYKSLNLQVDDAIWPGLILLDWTSLNIDIYLSSINKELGEHKSKQDP